MDQVRPVGEITIPWGRQQIELQEIQFAAGGIPMLRIRIREGRRFTILDIDAISARALGEAIAGWAGAVIDTAAPGCGKAEAA